MIAELVEELKREAEQAQSAAGNVLLADGVAVDERSFAIEQRESYLADLRYERASVLRTVAKLEALGAKPRELAAMLAMPVERINDLRRSAEYPGELDRASEYVKAVAQRTVNNALMVLAPSAVSELGALLGSKSEGIRLNASKEVLDRAGFLQQKDSRPLVNLSIVGLDSSIRRIVDVEQVAQS